VGRSRSKKVPDGSARSESVAAGHSKALSIEGLPDIKSCHRFLLASEVEVQVSMQGDLSSVVNLFVQQNPHDLAGGQRLPEVTRP